MKKGKIFSGMRPTGQLHIGHLSVIENWIRLQDEYDCVFGIVDWHALTTSFDDVQALQRRIRDIALDWLSAGLDPEKSPIMVQSQVKEHAELHLLFSMMTPLSWLERVPTYKDQIQQFGAQGKDISMYGFLGYPLLQAADILIYKATHVPVGQDQIPHIELSREVARRFNHLYQTEVFPEPQVLLSEVPLLPGIDNRKMSKSYGNDIALSASSEEIKEKVRLMVTDPARVRKTDLGNPDVCVVHTYHKIYNDGEVCDIGDQCRKAGIGCVACKQRLAAKLETILGPIRERRAELLAKPGRVDEILAEGSLQARAKAADTMEQVREAMGVRGVMD
ncbi:tryptophanyl-tRNA synthetase [Heliomicrobium modesticaldum Ice1]|uniref:Tryptophan--tRNA ligase n=1 Tax=Heliobacterium modesticaldum (strain ATCC 51547 / Ice1) TaxID=498761 RepID=B0TFC4_HELMI|nr:tryptophanyl-tRNA synthetase [Heliomicrobium modesticaldum Ice1]